MLRLLIKILRPNESELRKRKPSSSLRIKMWLHRSLVKMLAHFYRRYAVHDILSMNNGLRVEIEYRDPGFEFEVKCAKLETKQQFQPLRVLPSKAQRPNRCIRWFIRCFNWQHKVIVTDGRGKSLVIDHTSQMSLSGNMKIEAAWAKPGSLINTVKLAHSTGTDVAVSEVYGQDEPLVHAKPSRSSSGRRRRVPPPSKIPGSVFSDDVLDSSSETHDVVPINSSIGNDPVDDISRGSVLPPAAFESEKSPRTPTRPLKKMKGFDMDDSF